MAGNGPCTANVDCVDGQVCSKLDLPGKQTLCQTPGAGNPFGAPCTVNTDCTTKYCPSTGGGNCNVFCVKDSDCGAGLRCGRILLSPLAPNYPGICYAPCAHNADCTVPATVCKIQDNTTTMKLFWGCSRPAGQGKLGDPAGPGCESGLQDSMLCSAACVDGSDCIPALPNCISASIMNSSTGDTGTLMFCSK